MDKKYRSGAAGIKRSLIQIIERGFLQKKPSFYDLNMRLKAHISAAAAPEIFSRKEDCY
jgi:hypothetical protein